MIPRRLAPLLRHRLETFPAVALLGPRQVGKTTLARSLATATGASPQAGAGGAEGVDRPAPDYLDLENPADRAKLDDAGGYLGGRRGRLVILDEVQQAPGLFPILRGLIDTRILAGEPAGHFLILGSASIDLLRQSAETLAGRIAFLELGPLDVLEIGSDDNDALWVRGGFPRSLLAGSDADSALWRESFIATYLERDIPQLGPRIAAETLRRLWTMLAHGQGGLLNMAQLARSLAVDGKTVAAYLDLMVDLLLVRRLPPYHANIGKRLVKSPKVYIRDSGLVHALLRLDSLDQLLGHPVAGLSWEGHVLETLLRAAPTRTRASFYRTAAGAEADLVLELPGNRLWAVEIKRGTAPKVDKGLRAALNDLQPDRAFLGASGEDRYPGGGGLERIGLRALAADLAALPE